MTRMRELYQVWTSELEQGQIERILALGSAQPEENATIFSSSETMKAIRACRVRWISDAWLESLLWSYVKRANEHGFQVDVEPRAEMQISEYAAAQSAHYDWHHDVHWNGQANVDRKVSVTVQLSDSNTYEGGDFEFDEVKTNADFRSKGTVLVFPSYLRHRIHPVTSGKRLALVAWFSGPRWR